MLQLKEAINSIKLHIWSSEKEVGEFLAAFIKLNKLKSVVECGVFKGLTSVQIIDALPIDEGNYIGCDLEEQRSERVQQFFEEHNAKFFREDSREVLKKLDKRSMDLIFMDSFHEEEVVRTEFKEAERVIKQNGFIFIHDYYTSEGVPLWVNYIKTLGWFEVCILDTPEHRGLAMIKCLCV